MISFPSVMLGKYYLDRLPMNYLVEKYREKYYDLCKSLDHKPGNVVMLSHSHDNSMIYGTAKDLLNYEKG